jgi:hypothetical protein
MCPEVTLAKSRSQLWCGNIATLATDKVVVARTQSVWSGCAGTSEYYRKFLCNQQLKGIFTDTFQVAGALLSSERLSQPLSERS